MEVFNNQIPILNLKTLKIINKLRQLLSIARSKIYSLLLFGTPSFISIGKHVKIAGKKIKIGRGCHIQDFSSLLGNITINENVFIHENVLIRSFNYSIHIGNNTTINRNSCILSQCYIGNNCSIAPNVIIVGANHNFQDNKKLIKEQGSTSKGIIIEDNVWIAANVTILDGCKIGQGSIVAAGAVVNKDIPPKSIAGGVPARIIKER